MFFPEVLYRLSKRDEQVTWLDPVASRISATLAGINPVAIYTVPNDRVLVLTAACIEATPGVGQNILLKVLHTRPPTGGTNVTFRSDYVAGGVGVQQGMDWDGEIAVPPSWTVNGNVLFNAGAVASTATLMMHGLLIPVGNIQRL